MPYVTEELWQHLPHREGDKFPSIMLATFPTVKQSAAWFNPKLEDAIKQVDIVVRKIRAVNAPYISGIYHIIIIKFKE